jgi:dienelactone hydrolase
VIDREERRRLSYRDGERVTVQGGVLSRRTVCLAMTLAVLVACRDSPGGPTGSDGIAGFTLVGDPASSSGATWTYHAQESSIVYDLQGILLKPAGAGPFPAVIISHGTGQNAAGYSRDVARVMVGWGVVCIATNYTYAGGVPIGAPGTSSEAGATPNNVRRARRLVDILRGLGYVDINRVALHGHSAGAFVTEVTAAAHPDLFRAASHTAGGIASDQSRFRDCHHPRALSDTSRRARLQCPARCGRIVRRGPSPAWRHQRAPDISGRGSRRSQPGLGRARSDSGVVSKQRRAVTL